MASPLIQAMTFQNQVQPAQTGIAPTDVVGAYKLATDAAEKNYAAKIAERNAMWGGLAGLGGAGILSFGPSLAKKWLGSATSSALPASSLTAASDAAALPAASAPASDALDLGFSPFATTAAD